MHKPVQRVQTVSGDMNDRFYLLLEAFKELTGVPILINTSFNDNGEPIVETPRDAMNNDATDAINSFRHGSILSSP